LSCTATFAIRGWLFNPIVAATAAHSELYECIATSIFSLTTYDHRTTLSRNKNVPNAGSRRKRPTTTFWEEYADERSRQTIHARGHRCRRRGLGHDDRRQRS